MLPISSGLRGPAAAGIMTKDFRGRLRTRAARFDTPDAPAHGDVLIPIVSPGNNRFLRKPRRFLGSAAPLLVLKLLGGEERIQLALVVHVGNGLVQLVARLHQGKNAVLVAVLPDGPVHRLRRLVHGPEGG